MTSSRPPQKFLIGVIANLSGGVRLKRGWAGQHFVPITLANCDEFLARLQVRLTIPLPAVPNSQSATEPMTPPTIELRFGKLADFSRQAIAQQLPSVTLLRNAIAELQQGSISTNPDQELRQLQESLRDESRIALSDLQQSQQATAHDEQEISSALRSFFTSAGLAGPFQQSPSVCRAYIDLLEQQIEYQIDAVWNHPELQELLSNWTGLHYLLRKTHNCAEVEIRILDVTKAQVYADLSRAVEFDQSSLFKEVYDVGMNTPGATCYSLLLGAFEIHNHSDDLDLLQWLSTVAACAGAPLLTAASPQVFELDTWADLHLLPDLATLFARDKYAKWRSMRAAGDSNYVALCMPRIEIPLPPMLAGEKEVSCNPAFVLAGWLAATQLDQGWCLPQSSEASRTLADFAQIPVRDARGNWLLQSPCEVTIEPAAHPRDVATFVQPRELAHFGFLSLNQSFGKGIQFSAGLPSIANMEPQDTYTSVGMARARLVQSLEYLLPLSALTLFLRREVRFRQFQSRALIQQFVEKLVKSCLSSELRNASSRFPFSAATVTAEPIPGREVGTYITVVLKLGPGTADPEQELRLRFSHQPIV